MTPFLKLFTVALSLVAAPFVFAAESGAAGKRAEIERLRQVIAQHDELYHRKGVPEISDFEYDRLRQRLSRLERESPAAAKAVAPLAGIADDRTGRFATVRHRTPMMSLDKGYNESDLRLFDGRLTRALGLTEVEYVVEPKYDGLAVSVIFENGRLARAVTRGNGVEGDDITANVRLVTGLPHELSTLAAGVVPELIELRGEIYVPFEEFARVNAERELRGEPRFANPRNLAAGTVRQNDASEVTNRGLRAVFFGVGACEPARLLPSSQRDLLKTLESWRLPVVSESVAAHGVEQLVKVIDSLRTRRAGLSFPTDGAVIKVDAFAQQLRAGQGEAAPRWALAYKFAPERTEAKLIAVTLQVGRTGVLTPVAELEPVQLAGSRVARATLHNREEIARKDIRIGDFVYVEKAGDVIPAIVGVNLDRRPAHSRPLEFPIGCPSCFTPLSRSEAEATVRCPNVGCPAQVRRRVEHFASKACLDIDGLGPAMVETLVGNGWVNDFPDLYRLQRSELLKLGKNNEKSIDRLLAALEQSKRAELWRIIHGMGMPQVGAATAKDLARQCGSLAGLAEHGPKAAAVLGDPRYQGVIAELIALGFSPREAEPPSAASGEGRAAGKVFVLTGTLPTLSRTQAAARIEQAGGKVVGAVSPRTHYIVAGAAPGAKLQQAREQGVIELDETALLRILDGK